MFVGDLGNEVNDETLTLAFKQFSSFHKAKVIRERWSNKTKGYGFVSFLDSADMVAAMKAMNGAPTLRPPLPPSLGRCSLTQAAGAGKYIGNRPCKLRKSTWKERSAGSSKSMGPTRKSKGNKHMSKRFKGTMTH